MSGKKASKRHMPLTSGISVSAALEEILRSSFDEMARWESKARSWDDIEGVHQMRGNCPRMRAALRPFRSAVPKAVSVSWTDQLGWLAGQLADARDLDVSIAEALTPAADQLSLPGRDNLMALAEQRGAAAYDAVRATLDSDRYGRFKQDSPEWLKARDWEQADPSEKQRKNLDTNIVKYARKLLCRLDSNVLESGAGLDRNDAEHMHRLRIECKKLRYAAEFFAPIIPDLDAWVRHLNPSLTCC